MVLKIFGWFSVIVLVVIGVIMVVLGVGVVVGVMMIVLGVIGMVNMVVK